MGDMKPRFLRNAILGIWCAKMPILFLRKMKEICCDYRNLFGIMLSLGFLEMQFSGIWGAFVLVKGEKDCCVILEFIPFLVFAAQIFIYGVLLSPWGAQYPLDESLVLLP